MFATFWNFVLVSPILNLLMALYRLTGSLGWSIIFLTGIIRAVLIPVVAPSMKTMKKQRDLQPEINKLKEKYKHDQKKLAQEQMLLFKQHNINPASGCISQIAMIMVLIALFSVIQLFAVKNDVNNINSKIYFSNFRLAPEERIATNFGYLDLAKPDPYFVFAILAGVLQFVASKMMMPYIEKAAKAAEKTEPKTDDMAFQMQQQSLYMMPIMNIIIGITLPSGIMIYIVVTTLFTIVQNYYSSGWGGMKPFINKLRLAKKVI
jgi:YidC/Oxa1 family membrane protein insertase